MNSPELIAWCEARLHYASGKQPMPLIWNLERIVDARAVLSPSDLVIADHIAADIDDRVALGCDAASWWAAHLYALKCN